MEFLQLARTRDAEGKRLFQDVRSSKLPDITSPSGLICCSDAMQRTDLNGHISKIWGERQAEEQIHEIKFAGAGLFVGASVIIGPFRESDFIADQISKGIQLGRIVEALAIVAHYRCGLADSFGLNIYNCVELLVHGREALSGAFPELSVVAMMQIDYKDNPLKDRHDKRTYHVDTSYWPVAKEALAKLCPPAKTSLLLSSSASA